MSLVTTWDDMSSIETQRIKDITCNGRLTVDEFNSVLQANQHHIKALRDIAFSYDIVLDNSIYNQCNLYYLAKHCQKIIKIGFNAGTSTLVMLLADKTSSIVCLDTCNRPYTLECYKYLSREFSDRLTLLVGNTEKIFKRFSCCVSDKFDLFHIAGEHNENSVYMDYINTRSLSSEGTIVVFDNYDYPIINKVLRQILNVKYIKPFDLLYVKGYHQSYGFHRPGVKIALVSCGATTKYTGLSKKIYCKKYGYTFYDEYTIPDICDNVQSDKQSIKFHLLLNVLENNASFDYVLWTNGNSYIMNDSINIESLILAHMDTSDILLTRNPDMIDSSVMLLRNTEWTRQFLSVFKNTRDNEYGIFNYMYKINEMFSQKHIKVLEAKCVLVNQVYNFSYGNFILLTDSTECCPIRMDSDTNETFNLRLEFIKQHKNTYE